MLCNETGVLANKVTHLLRRGGETHGEELVEESTKRIKKSDQFLRSTATDSATYEINTVAHGFEHVGRETADQEVPCFGLSRPSSAAAKE